MKGLYSNNTIYKKKNIKLPSCTPDEYIKYNEWLDEIITMQQQILNQNNIKKSDAFIIARNNIVNQKMYNNSAEEKIKVIRIISSIARHRRYIKESDNETQKEIFKQLELQKFINTYKENIQSISDIKNTKSDTEKVNKPQLLTLFDITPNKEEEYNYHTDIYDISRFFNPDGTLKGTKKRNKKNKYY